VCEKEQTRSEEKMETTSKRSEPSELTDVQIDNITDLPVAGELAEATRGGELGSALVQPVLCDGSVRAFR
jgi:hypothetical protein